MPIQALRATLRKRSGGPDLVAAGIRQQIVDGNLKPGDRLPDERSMAEALGVARVTVRTAYTLLQSEGLLERLQGRGTTVRDHLAWGGPALLIPWLNAAESRGELEEAAEEFLAIRRHMAAAVLMRVPVPFGEAEARPLLEAIELMRLCIEQGEGLELIVAADLRVAKAFVAAANSPALQLMFNPISATLREQRALRDALYQRPAENLRAWRAMLAWAQKPSRDVTAMIDGMRLRDETTLRRMRDYY